MTISDLTMSDDAPGRASESDRLSPDDITALKQAFGCFATGVTIVTIEAADGTPRGFTANSFTSLSLHPPLCLICVGDQVRSFDDFSVADRFAVSVLSSDQQHVAQLFASHDDDRFSKVGWHPGQGGAPIIDGALSWFDCAVEQRVQAADRAFSVNTGSPKTP
jgi:flavin reductase (DIM6/NTAB) family NADH-FMN oxidoreductase RutF